jgi:hypothetical protein
MLTMDNEGNWYRQLGALVLLSASRAAVEYLTNPGARDEAESQLKSAFRDIDYDAVARAITRVIDDLADNSKSAVGGSIDTLRDKGHEAVDQVKTVAEERLAEKKRGGGKLRLMFLLAIGGAIAYFLFDEQRRDDLLDRLTGASGPIQQSNYSTFQSSTPPAASGSGSASSAPSSGSGSATESATPGGSATSAPQAPPAAADTPGGTSAGPTNGAGTSDGGQ